MSDSNVKREAAEDALSRISGRVDAWFAPDALARMLGAGGSATERLGLEWLGCGGKRWRPLLAATVYHALRGRLPPGIARAAVAVECFHKASLVHDDIEDADAERYGAPTLHARVGVPLAINVGDWMVMEGYRLLSGGDFPAETRCELLRVSIEGIRRLCLGQGDELAYCLEPGEVSEEEVLLLYGRKTASAFEVAVQIGAAAAGAGPALRGALSDFIRPLGTAYQIRDDQEDFADPSGRAADRLMMRPTLYLAGVCGEPPGSEARRALEAVRREPSPENRARLRRAVSESGIPAMVAGRFDGCFRRSLGLLPGIDVPGLRDGLLAIVRRIFGAGA